MSIRQTILFLHLILICSPIVAQQDSAEHSGISKGRLLLVSGIHATVWTGSFLALNQAWYADFKRTSFHTFNDNTEWNQMDKAGHIWSAYGLSRASAAAWKWAGLQQGPASLLGGASGLLYQSVIEMQDAYSADWGFSWGDMAANAFGSGLFAAQEVMWGRQRIQIKFSYWPSVYSAATIDRRDQLFGSTIPERILKDYNSQTYWLSVNIAGFAPNSSLPGWLNLAAGYGSSNLLGARSNKWRDEEGRSFDFSSSTRLRRFYLSPDIDLTRIQIRKKWLRSILFVLNAVKIPAPALELNSRGILKFHVIKF